MNIVGKRGGEYEERARKVQGTHVVFLMVGNKRRKARTRRKTRKGRSTLKLE